MKSIAAVLFLAASVALWVITAPLLLTLSANAQQSANPSSSAVTAQTPESAAQSSPAIRARRRSHRTRAQPVAASHRARIGTVCHDGRGRGSRNRAGARADGNAEDPHPVR